VVAVFEAGPLAGAAGVGVAAGFASGVVEAPGVAAADVADFFERDFFGVVELSTVALLSAASAFFGVVFFFVDAVPESGGACELEAAASAFFFFLPFVAVLELV
jgi:hypothetical protein